MKKKTKKTNEINEILIILNTYNTRFFQEIIKAENAKDINFAFETMKIALHWFQVGYKDLIDSYLKTKKKRK